jgi:hypothetical protein
VYCFRMTPLTPPLSPLDALGPAFRRTREVLGQPFRLGFFLKIALIAALTQPSFYSASISYPFDGVQFAFMPHAGRPGHFTGQFVDGAGLAAFGVAAILVGVLIAIGLWVLISYLYCRVRFTLFDLVVYKRGFVGQAWSTYRRQSWRYFGLVILVSLGFFVVAAVILGPAFLNVVKAIKPLGNAGSNVDPFRILGIMLPLLGAAFLVAMLWAIVDTLMQDFLLPPMAIEDAPLERAFGRFFDMLKSSFGSVVIYLLLRFAVGIGITWAMMLVAGAVFFVGGVALFGIGTLLYHALWASMLGQVICVALAILAGLVVLALYFAVIVAIFGIAGVFKQSYAAYFFGGRYPELGERLEPPPVAQQLPQIPEPPSSPGIPPGLPPLSDAPSVW